MNPSFVSKCISFQQIHGSMKEFVVVLANEGGIVSILGMNCFLYLSLFCVRNKSDTHKKGETVQTKVTF